MGRHEGMADEIVEIIRKEDEELAGMVREQLMMRIAELWTAYTSYEFDARDVAMLLALTKVAEIAEDECGREVYDAAALEIRLAGEIGGRG